MSNRSCLVAVLLVGFSAPTLALSWNERFDFPASAIDISTTIRDGQAFDLVSVSRDARPAGPELGVLTCLDPGKPALPCWTFTLVVPQGMKVGRVDATPRRTVTLPGTYRVFPAQPPITFHSGPLPAFVPADPVTYSSGAAWPSALAEAGPVGVKSGFRLVTVTLYPLRYRPASGLLELATSLDVTVSYERDPAARTGQLTERQLAVVTPAVQALVANPGDVTRCAPPSRATDWGNIDCVIITSAALEPSFAPLVTWHTAKGYRTETRTTTWVDANYTGRDLQERIRNFIIDYYSTQGLFWVILGGDNTVVPARLARAIVQTPAGPDTGAIATDLYYADLQGTWDNDGDNIFGEEGDDTVDLYYDLCVGRASVDDAAQVQTFVTKVLTHEQTPPTTYLTRILLASAPLWSGYNHYQANDSIALITPGSWTDVHLYDPNDNTTIRDSINNGFQFVHLVGHGSETAVWNGGTEIYNAAAAASQTNGSKANFMNSIACRVGNFEYSDCLAEAAHNHSGGGSLGVIMNSHDGWGTPPYIGPSELLDVRFYDYFFIHNTLPLGLTHTDSKEVYRNSALGQQMWRWCYYELNLFGDPLLMTYKTMPIAMDASFEDTIGLGSQNFTVTVASGPMPLANALVCVWKGSEVYDRGYTNGSGQITFSINPTTAGPMSVTATLANHLPDIDTCYVLAVSGDAGCYRIVSPPGTVDSGTVITPRAMVRNFGLIPVWNIPVSFRIGAVYSALDTVAFLGAGDSVAVTFPNWTAVPGSYAVCCSTRLAGDANPANDAATLALFVRYRDVGPTSIAAPPVVDSGATVLPEAVIRNFGNTGESFNVRLSISGTPYIQTATRTLGAGQQDTVVFPAWIALQRGEHVLSCTTMLAGDMNQGNDRVTCSTFVRVTDVGCVAIVSPAGSVDSAPTLAITARITNYGNTPMTFPAVFNITGPAAWTDTTTVADLPPGDTALVAFDDWPVGPRGGYLAACSTRAAGDQFGANDRYVAAFNVVVHDAAVLAIAAPGPEVDTGTTVPVRVAVANYGSLTDDFDVHAVIGWQYSDVRTVTLPPGATDTVDMQDWTVGMPRGDWPVTCFVSAWGDVDPANDTLVRTVTIRVPDAAPLEITAPAGGIDSGEVVVPEALVANVGTSAENIPVRFTISDGYTADTSVSLAPGAESLVSFAPWTATAPGIFATRCSTMLAGDAYPGNDFASGFVSVSVSDVAVTDILAPAGEINTGPVTPVARVANYSPAPLSFPVYLTIRASGGALAYSDSAPVTALESDSTFDVAFTSWTAGAGSYVVRCSTGLAGDLNPANDTLSVDCDVFGHDVGVTAIHAPAGIIQPTLVTPRVRVTNFGIVTESCAVHMVIRNSVTGDIVYLDSTSADSLPGGGVADVELPPWPGPVGRYQVSSYTVLPGDNAPGNDTAYVSLIITLGALGWQPRADIPNVSVPVRQGGCMAGIAGELSMLYALKGNRTREFYGYDVVDGTWFSLPELPAGPSGRPVKNAADMCSDDERYVYACKGNRTPEFYRYDTETGAWEQLADIPGPKPPKYGTRLAHVRVDGEDYIYCLKASKTFEFYAYSVSTGSWSTRAPAPPGPSGQSYKKGSALCADGDTRLFAVKGRYNEFFTYDVVADYWALREPMPMYGYTEKKAKAKDGADITSDEAGVVYAFPGGNRDFFFAYSVPANTWTELAPLPLGGSGRQIKAGGALWCLDRQVWALKGNKTNEFWVYTPDTMTLFRPASPRRDVQAGSPAGAADAGPLAVFPNPATGRVVCVSVRTDVPGRVELYSPLGCVVRAAPVLPGRVTELSIDGLACGTYFVRFTGRGAVETRKLVIR